MDVGVHSSASSATKSDAVPVFARAVPSAYNLDDPPDSLPASKWS